MSKKELDTHQQSDSTVKPIRSDEDIKKLAKRITNLMRELEAHSMDMVLYAKPLAAGKFPATHIAQVANAIDSATTELTRIKNGWLALFKEEVENVK